MKSCTEGTAGYLYRITEEATGFGLVLYPAYNCSPLHQHDISNHARSEAEASAPMPLLTHLSRSTRDYQAGNRRPDLVE